MRSFIDAITNCRVFGIRQNREVVVAGGKTLACAHTRLLPGPAWAQWVAARLATTAAALADEYSERLRSRISPPMCPAMVARRAPRSLAG